MQQTSTLVVVRLPDRSWDIRRIKRHIAGPFSEPTVVVNGIYPVLQETSFDPGLLSILAFNLQDQVDPIGQVDE